MKRPKHSIANFCGGPLHGEIRTDVHGIYFVTGDLKESDSGRLEYRRHYYRADLMFAHDSEHFVYRHDGAQVLP